MTKYKILLLSLISITICDIIWIFIYLNNKKDTDLYINSINHYIN